MSEQELSQDVLDVISREAMQEYEDLRQFGLCNMLDLNCVVEACDGMGFYALLDVADERAAYVTLLGNFSALMRHYGISQEKRKQLYRDEHNADCALNHGGYACTCEKGANKL